MPLTEGPPVGSRWGKNLVWFRACWMPGGDVWGLGRTGWRNKQAIHASGPGSPRLGGVGGRKRARDGARCSALRENGWRDRRNGQVWWGGAFMQTCPPVCLVHVGLWGPCICVTVSVLPIMCVHVCVCVSTCIHASASIWVHVGLRGSRAEAGSGAQRPPRLSMS